MEIKTATTFSTLSGSWSSTSFLSLRRRNGRRTCNSQLQLTFVDTLCKRWMIRRFSSSLSSGWSTPREACWNGALNQLIEALACTHPLRGSCQTFQSCCNCWKWMVRESLICSTTLASCSAAVCQLRLNLSSLESKDGVKWITISSFVMLSKSLS